MDIKILCDKCDKQIKELLGWFKEHWGAFQSMNLKLYDAAFYDDYEKEFPIVYKYAQENPNYDPFNEFAEIEWENFDNWCSEEGINFRKLAHHIGSTSTFYLHDYNNQVCFKSRGGRGNEEIDPQNTMVCLMSDLGYADLEPEFNEDGTIDREYAKENADDLEANLDYIASGEFNKDVKKEFEDTLKVYDHIANFKENQVKFFKDWLEGEQEWIEDSNPELAEEGDNKIDNRKITEGFAGNYRLLSRLKSDCDYFLGNGNGYEGHLWAKNVDDQIKKMRELYDSFPDDAKPEWLTLQDIDNYESQMKNYKSVKSEGVNMKKVAQICKFLIEGESLADAIATSEYEAKVQALLNFLEWDDDEDHRARINVSSYNTNVYQVDGDNDFLICTDDEADEEHTESIQNLADDIGLEMFGDSWVLEHVLENYVNTEWFDDYFTEDMRSYAEDIQNETSSKEITVDGEDVEITNRLFIECLEQGVIQESDLELSDIEGGDYVGDKDLVELYSGLTPEDLGYDDSVDWFKFNFGSEQLSDVVKEYNLVNWDEVAEWIRDTDGRGNELSRWDGNEYEEEVNGETYYIYPDCDYKNLK